MIGAFGTENGGLDGVPSSTTLSYTSYTDRSLPNGDFATYSVVINDLGDNGNVTSGRSVVDENNSADLDESLESGRLLGLDISSLCLFTVFELVGQAEQLQSVSFSP